MAVPAQPTNVTAQQADGNVLISWAQVSGATSYQVQRSTDGITFANLGTANATAQYTDLLPGVGYQYFYQVAGVNGSGTGTYSAIVNAVAAPPSELSLAELRLQSQQTADRVNSNFVTTQEWNQNIRLAMYELYDLLIGSYEDYYATQLAYITTNGSQQYYPLPDGITNYPGGVYNSATSYTFTCSSANAQVNAVYQNSNSQSANYQFTVQSTISPGTTLVTNGTGTPSPVGMLTKVSGNGDNQIYYQSFAVSLSGQPAQSYYKMAGVDLAVNTSTVNPAWVTLKKFNFIDRNKYVYPNSTSTIYGVYNQAYRVMGQQIDFIPVPAGNQTIRMWYAPRLPSLLADSDITTLGFSGWLRYPIVRAAIYALVKEESDTSMLAQELVFLKQRIEQMAQNRDAGIPDTISETRRDGIYGGGWGGGNSGNNAGW